MGISRTPFQLSFFGRGTDYPGWYRQHGGAALATTIDMVDEGLSVLTSKSDWQPFGELLHEAWQLKKSLSTSISNPEIDQIYETARKEGTIDGKIFGAGGGGFLLLSLPPEKQSWAGLKE